jgi:DNA modification methylase
MHNAVLQTDHLLLGDNLEHLHGFPDECIDLIYLDPPFFSNRHYSVVWGDEGEVRSFNDEWEGGIQEYIVWLKQRVQEMYRVLKPTGSLFLHCDHHANAYIRVHILDTIFGMQNFRNEIIWCYKSPSNTKRYFPSKHDTIFRYSKTAHFTFNKSAILIPYDALTLERRRYAETQSKGIPFKGKEMEHYLRGHLPNDWWDDIPAGGQMSKYERMGYPTQKPEKLLSRIITVASNPGEIVLDPFVGGGTTVVVAARLERKWIGIDSSPTALAVTSKRVQMVKKLTTNKLF